LSLAIDMISSSFFIGGQCGQSGPVAGGGLGLAIVDSVMK
jgi:hypothetical protein